MARPASRQKPGRNPAEYVPNALEPGRRVKSIMMRPFSTAWLRCDMFLPHKRVLAAIRAKLSKPIELKLDGPVAANPILDDAVLPDTLSVPTKPRPSRYFRSRPSVPPIHRKPGRPDRRHVFEPPEVLKYGLVRL